jgi:CHASE2 domain-containing sensor protein
LGNCDPIDNGKPQINNLRYEEFSLAWIIALILLIFYGLGLFVFHGTKAIHTLPLLVLLVVVSDYLIAKRFRSH